jgi:hypothetical protein
MLYVWYGMIGDVYNSNPLAQELTPIRFSCIRSALIKSVTEFAINDLEEPIGLICNHLDECIEQLVDVYKIQELNYYLRCVAYWSKIIRDYGERGYDVRATWRYMMEQLQKSLDLLSITYDIERV